MNLCEICGRPAAHTHHLVFGNGIRNLADEDGLTMELCSACHNTIHENPVAGNLSKKLGQILYEKDYIEYKPIPFGDNSDAARKAFRKRYGRSWM